MFKNITKLVGFTLILISVSVVSPASAETIDEKLSFAGYLEETLGHLWAIEQNLDDNNAELALVHATHPIAELYDLMKPQLVERDVELDSKIKQILFELREKTSSSVTREQAQEAIEQARSVVEVARSTIVGDVGDKTDFKIKLMIGLLETSKGEYSEAIENGQISMMAEFQDGSAFVWRSQQIYNAIKSEVPEKESKEIDEFFTELWNAYDEHALPEKVETLANAIIHDLEEVAGIETEKTELTDYVLNIRNLLSEAKDEYGNGKTDEALSLVTKAYLDNYEFLEATVGDQDSELNDEIEHKMREELRDRIKNGAPVSEVNTLIDEILVKMDTVETIVPEFGPITAIVFALTISAIFFSLKHQKFNLLQKIK